MAAEWLERHPRILDVGCLQINLGYHPAAFRSLDEAFDPAANAAYAAHFLRGLRDETGSWPKAVAAYHSRRPVEGQRYLTQVLAVWRPPAGRPPTVQLAAYTTVAPLPAAPREAVVRLPSADDIAPEIAPRLWLAAGTPARRRRGGAAIAVARGNKAASAGAPIPLTPAAKPPPLLIRVPAAGPPPPRQLTVIEGQAALDRLDALPSSDRLPALLALRRRALPFAALSASLGSTYAELGDTAKAELFMAQAAELAPDQPRYRLNQAVLADHLGWHRQAIGAYEQFLAAYWRDPEEPPLPLAAIHQRLAYLRATARGPD